MLAIFSDAFLMAAQDALSGTTEEEFVILTAGKGCVEWPSVFQGRPSEHHRGDHGNEIATSKKRTVIIAFGPARRGTWKPLAILRDIGEGTISEHGVRMRVQKIGICLEPVGQQTIIGIKKHDVGPMTVMKPGVSGCTQPLVSLPDANDSIE